MGTLLFSIDLTTVDVLPELAVSCEEEEKTKKNKMACNPNWQSNPSFHPTYAEILIGEHDED